MPGDFRFTVPYQLCHPRLLVTFDENANEIMSRNPFKTERYL